MTGQSSYQSTLEVQNLERHIDLAYARRLPGAVENTVVMGFVFDEENLGKEGAAIQ